MKVEITGSGMTASISPTQIGLQVSPRNTLRSFVSQHVLKTANGRRRVTTRKLSSVNHQLTMVNGLKIGHFANFHRNFWIFTFQCSIRQIPLRIWEY
uniref:FHA domain-containing protein n=1 Tax=Ascaris lumbricoides TaxID=6252 RepID=A0A0M3IBH8_ASCLU